MKHTQFLMTLPMNEKEKSKLIFKAKQNIVLEQQTKSPIVSFIPPIVPFWTHQSKINPLPLNTPARDHPKQDIR